MTYNPADFKPGDVAMVTLAEDHPLGPVTLRGLRADDYDGEPIWRLPESGYRAGGIGVESARPLVTLDSESDEDVERLRREYDRAITAATTSDDGTYVAFLHSAKQRTDAMRAALRALTRPPKPDEPTGLGAVVEQDGTRWVRMIADERVECRWRRSGPTATWQPWSVFEPTVRVLQGGWTE